MKFSASLRLCGGKATFFQTSQPMELTKTSKNIFIETAKTLKGHARRIFMARVVKSFGKGGQRRAEPNFGRHQYRKSLKTNCVRFVRASFKLAPTCF